MALMPEVRKDSPRVLGFLPRTSPQVPPPDLVGANSGFTPSNPLVSRHVSPMINIPLRSFTCPHPWKTTVIGCCFLDIGTAGGSEAVAEEILLSAEDG